MPNRIEQVNELIRQELGRIMLEDLEFEPGVMATILAVDTSDTMEHAKVYISVFPENRTGSALELLNKEIGSLQKRLNRKLALRFVPKIKFVIDESQEAVDKIEGLLDELNSD